MMSLYEGAAYNNLVVIDAGDGDVAFRTELAEDGDPDGDVILLRQQVQDLIEELTEIIERADLQI